MGFWGIFEWRACFMLTYYCVLEAYLVFYLCTDYFCYSRIYWDSKFSKWQWRDWCQGNYNLILLSSFLYCGSVTVLFRIYDKKIKPHSLPLWLHLENIHLVYWSLKFSKVKVRDIQNMFNESEFLIFKEILKKYGQFWPNSKTMRALEGKLKGRGRILKNILHFQTVRRLRFLQLLKRI